VRGLSDLARLDATALLHALGTRRIGASELLEATMARARATAELNAVVASDPERNRAAARRIDERRANAEPNDALGLLGGLPLAVSDTLDVDGMAATAGRPAWKDRPVGDAHAVGHARSEGALPWAKTNTADDALGCRTASRLYGVTRNPFDQSRGTGGASGGAAAALAAGAAALAIGSDLDGGLLVPAGVTGVFAHRPTYGLVSQRGHVPPAPGRFAEPDLNVVGPLARSARDLRLLLSVMSAGPLPAKAPAAQLSELKLGLWLEGLPLEAPARGVMEDFADRLAAAGCKVEPIEAPVEAEALRDTFATLVESLRGADDPPSGIAVLAARLMRGFGAGRLSKADLTLKRVISHRQWLQAHEARARYGHAMRRLFERFEAIVAPAAPGPALLEGRRASPLAPRYGDWSALSSTCHLPATVVPAGRTGGGLPVGAQLIGPRGGDSRTLALAQALDGEVLGFTPPPLA
jgi:amidase